MYIFKRCLFGMLLLSLTFGNFLGVNIKAVQADSNEINYDDTDSAIVYTGKWAATSGLPGPYNNSLMTSKVVGETATLTFTGDRLTILYPKYPGGGRIDVSIDNIGKGSISQSSGTKSYQNRWNYTNLGSGQHTVKITHSRLGKVSLDGFIAMDKPIVAVGGTYEDDNLGILAYDGNWLAKNGMNGPSSGTSTYSYRVGNKVGFKFNGMVVKLIYPKASGFGKMDVLIDGQTRASISENATKTSYQNKWESDILPPGDHEVVLIHRSGYRIAIDAIEITAVVPPLTDEPLPGKDGWKLVFNDVFDAYSVDTNTWATQFWWGRTNAPEAQYYTQNNFKFLPSVVRLQANKQSYNGYKYTSGILTTYNSFKMLYGYVEMKARIPAGKGLWPAFWLLTYKHESDAEIDVFEILGQEPDRAYMTMHYNDASGKHQFDGSSFKGPDLSQDFHTYAVEWSPTAVIWYIDGVERKRMTEHVPQEPMYMIANLAVGGTWPGYPDSTTHFPANFDIAYIRVYQQ